MRGNIDFSNANALMTRAMERLRGLNEAISRHYDSPQLVAMLREDKREAERELADLEAEIERLRNESIIEN